MYKYHLHNGKIAVDSYTYNMEVSLLCQTDWISESFGWRCYINEFYPYRVHQFKYLLECNVNIFRFQGQIFSCFIYALCTWYKHRKLETWRLTSLKKSNVFYIVLIKKPPIGIKFTDYESWVETGIGIVFLPQDNRKDLELFPLKKLSPRKHMA